MMKGFAALIEALAGFAWPTLFVFFLWHFRDSIAGLLKRVSEQVGAGATIKYGQLELVGKSLEEITAPGGRAVYQRVSADAEISHRRHEIYKNSKNLFLVHRFKKVDLTNENGMQYFDISIYIVGHKSYGRLNQVDYVEYYLGEYFGSSEFPAFGAKYVVTNSADGFAIKLKAYGPTLCEARLNFHDGTSAILYRYLDFEGSGYRSNA